MTQNNYEKLREVRILDAGCTTGTLERAGGILLRRAVSLSLMYWHLVASEAAASGKTLVCLRRRPKMLGREQRLWPRHTSRHCLPKLTARVSQPLAARRARLAFVPCGHQRFCASCVAHLEQQARGCPMDLPVRDYHGSASLQV